MHTRELYNFLLAFDQFTKDLFLEYTLLFTNVNKSICSRIKLNNSIPSHIPHCPKSSSRTQFVLAPVGKVPILLSSASTVNCT